MTQLAEKSFDFLRERLRDAGITTAMVVDDAFDVPTLSSVGSEVGDLWNALEREEGALEQLKSLGIVAESEDDFDDEAISILWEKRAESSSLARHVNATLFGSVGPSLQPIEGLVRSLEELKLTVDKVGTYESDESQRAGLVFMDYFLGQPSDAALRGLSAAKARKIYDSTPMGANKPFIILMSSLTDVESQADQFRRDSNLVGGLFDFASKDELKDPIRLALRLAGWASNMSHRHHVQQFVETLESALKEGSKEFIQKARSLTIDEYAFVQSLSLKEDGQPLGDYMQWLLSPLLVKSVFEDSPGLSGSRKTLNGMSFTHQQVRQLVPSAKLAEIYSIAIAEHGLEPIDRHPRIGDKAVEETAQVEEEATDDNETSVGGNSVQEHLPLLRFGDLLVKNEGQRVYMVATPDCDLQFAPDAERKLKGTEVVLLVPGNIVPLEKRKERDTIETEPYLSKGVPCRIEWDRREILTIPIGQFFDWYALEGCSRPARIRLPYAVRIQQEILSRLSRIGMPVAPPLQDVVAAELFFEDHEGKWQQSDHLVDAGVVVLHGRNGPTLFAVTSVVLDEVVSKLEVLIDRYAKVVGSPDGGVKERQIKKLARLEQCFEDPESLVHMVEKRSKLPGPGNMEDLVGDVVGFHRNGALSVRCPSNHFVCVNIVY